MNVKSLADPISRMAKSRGYRISYEDVGQGSPVVLVPGLFQSASDYRQAGYVDRLATTRRVLVVDPLGHGQSDKPHEAEAYGPPDVAADVIAVMDAARIESAALWGYSRGAALACAAAIEFPLRVTALILGGAGGLNPGPTLPDEEMAAWVDALSRADWTTFWSVFPVPMAPEVQLHFEDINDPKASGAAMKGYFKSDYVFDFSRVSARSLVYCGGDDDPDGNARTAQGLKAELHVIDGLRHFEAFEEVDSVMPLAIAFLETTATA